MTVEDLKELVDLQYQMIKSLEKSVLTNPLGFKGLAEILKQLTRRVEDLESRDPQLKP